MKRTVWMGLLLLLVLPGLLFTTACSKKAVKSDSGMAADDDAARRAEADRRAREEAERRRLEEERMRAEQAKSEKARMAFMNEDIYFEFDRSDLLPEAQAVLRDKADFLKANPKGSVIVEGHCDERGTNEYNLALGDRRAEAAKAYLINLGVPAARMETVSYGEERPVDPGNNESAWAKNRRAHFVLQ
jgi:peptidoglycan-associated lipoprotein